MKETINKKEVVKRTVEKLKGTKITVGGNKYFYKRAYNLKYTQVIVDNVITALLEVLTDTIEDGDSVKLVGYFTLKPHYYAKRRVGSINDGEDVYVPERYLAKISLGTKLREACERLSENVFGERR